MMYKRALTDTAKKLFLQYPIISITGPRQSGKTTFSKETFPECEYVSLEDLDLREFAQSDPRSFLKRYAKKVIFDEIQHVPSLFSYLQTHVDSLGRNSLYILTGSQQFLLNKNIAQSLAGRTALLRMLPLSLAELMGRVPQTLWQTNSITNFSKPSLELEYVLFHGNYPRIYQDQLNPSQFFRDYLETYITRDLQELIRIHDKAKFQLFLRMLAARCGQRVNLTSLGNDAGVSYNTIERWLEALEASYIIARVQPYYKNLNKRLMKTSKCYFLDTGLLCYLLRIQSSQDLLYHAQLGSIFECFIFNELTKNFFNQAHEASLYYWQDNRHNEIDFIIEYSQNILPIEAKAGRTLNKDFFINLKKWLAIKQNSVQKAYLIYGGDQFFSRENIDILPWFAIS